MADIVIAVVGKLAEYTVAPVLRQFGYLIFYKRNVRDLTEKVTTLASKRDGVQLRVDGADRNIETILPDVQNWLDLVNKTIQEKETCFHEERVEKATTCCSSNCWCPNLKVRHSLSRKATKMAPELDKLIEDGTFTIISCPAPPRKLDYPAIQYVDDYTEAPVKRNEAASSSSATSNPTNSPAPMSLSERRKYRLPFTKDLLTALQDEKISVIGICGTVREIDTIKTEEFIKLMKEKKLFEEVVMAVASQDPDVKRIQGEVAEMLDLKLENGSLVERAERLRAVLSASESKRILVILTDVCGILDWEAIGVSPVDIMKSCKIMLISQLPNVFSEMVTQRNFKLLVHSTPIARPVEFESRISVIRGVMDALTDDESNPIVLCGMGGIGKTTLLMEIAAKACEVDLYHDVADAEFTQEPDLIKIQGKLGKGLGLEFKENDDRAQRAAMLRERLSGGAKRKLLILDNVWTGPDLWEIGIPIIRDPTCCKLLVSSRDQNIFHEMKAKKSFLLDGLPKHDAWSLFKKVAGSSIELDHELLPIAEQVLDECDGLPVAISTVGGALQGKSIPEWRNALRELRNSCPENVPGVIKHVYGKIVYSYECLPNEEVKSCFLLCCLLPESQAMPIETLVRYVIGLDLLKDIDSIFEGRDCVQALVDTLKCRSLLLNTNEKDSVRMHDVVHDVARYIASEESAQKRNEQLERRIVLRQGVELNHWRRSNGIMESAFCCSLTTNMSTTTELLLLETPDGRQPEMLATLFNGMEDLKVLSISTLVLPFFPHLKKLRALALVNCDLDFAEIGELRTLMILNLEASDIKQLPDKFRKLSNLRLLDLTRCWNLQEISPGVISSLSRLEELYMWDSFQDWGLEKLASTEPTRWISQLKRDARSQELDTWEKFKAVEKLTSGRDFFAEYDEIEEQRRDVFAKFVRGLYGNFDLLTRCAKTVDWRVGSLSELLSLSGLTALEVVLPPIDILLTSQLFHKLERFKISIGWEELRYTKQMDIGNYLRVHDLEASSLAGTGVSLLLKKTKTLELGMKNLIDPLNVLDVNWSANLESLNLQGCHSLEYLIDLTLQEYTPQSVFPVLNNLSIAGAKRLKGIIHGDTLDVLDVNCCPNLESLTLQDCESLEYLIDLTLQEYTPQSVFPVLKNLSITGAGRLKGIIHGDPLHPLDVNCFANLESLTLERCYSLKYLIDVSPRKNASVSAFPFLNNLTITGAWRLKGIIHGDPLNVLDVNCCPNLESLTLEDCHSLELEYLIDLTLQEYTPQSVFPVLNNLSIAGAKRLKGIIHGDLPQGSLRKLKRVHLTSLPALTSICIVESESASAGDLAALESIEIRDCPSLEVIFGCIVGSESASAGDLAALESIEIRDCPSLEVIFGFKGCGHHVKGINFRSLTTLELERLPSVMGISRNTRDLTIEPAALFSNPKVVFPVLRDVKIEGLDNLKEIWNSQLSPTSFSQLRSLLVRECDKLLYLGPTQMQNTLQNLETITIIKCSSMEEIFEVRRLTVNEGNASVSLSESIVSNTSQPDQGMQIIMDIKQDCQAFQNLTSLVVDSCDNLRYVLSLSIARGLVKLQRLEIKYCKEMETIFAADDGEETENNESLLPQLDYLKLWDLPNLGSLSHANYKFDWPLLRAIDIGFCKKMNKFCSGSLSISSKVRISVSGCSENLEQELNNSRRES